MVYCGIVKEINRHRTAKNERITTSVWFQNEMLLLWTSCYRPRKKADLLIALTAVDRNLTTNVIVIGKDTDLLILLLLHYQGTDTHKLYFTSSGEKNFKARQTLPPMIVECILPIHAFLGCNTVSRVHSIGKGEELLKKIIASEEMQMYFREFNKKDADNTTIAEFDEKLLSQFYESKTGLALNSLRYRLFHKKVVTATTAIASESLLKVVRCGCKTGCKTMTCSCRKHGLKCTDSCRECRGVSCLNCQDIDSDLFDKWCTLLFMQSIFCHLLCDLTWCYWF